VKSALGVLEVEVRAHGIRPPLDPTPHMDRVDVLGEGLRLLEALAAGDGPSPSQTLRIEAGDLATQLDADADLDEYLRELLSDELPTLLEALLEEKS